MSDVIERILKQKVWKFVLKATKSLKFSAYITTFSFSFAVARLPLSEATQLDQYFR